MQMWPPPFEDSLCWAYLHSKYSHQPGKSHQELNPWKSKVRRLGGGSQWSPALVLLALGWVRVATGLDSHEG